MIVAEKTPREYPPSGPAVTPPPFGDLSSRELITALILAHQGLPTVRRLDLGRRGATPDDARRELRRRSSLGAEVVRP
jgi:hypothetical protein